MKFNIQLYSDGRPKKYGNAFGLDIDEAVDELIYYDTFSEQYSEEELKEYLEKMKVGYVMRGTAWSEFKITKHI